MKAAFLPINDQDHDNWEQNIWEFVAMNHIDKDLPPQPLLEVTQEIPSRGLTSSTSSELRAIRKEKEFCWILQLTAF